jgi:hypothetical protein
MDRMKIEKLMTFMLQAAFMLTATFQMHFGIKFAFATIQETSNCGYCPH